MLFVQSMLSRYLRISAVVLVLAIMFSLFVLGTQPIAVNLVPTPWDKLLHSSTFALLAWGIGIASGLRGWRGLSVAFGAGLLVGVLDEYHQFYLPGRQPGWSDLAADAIGSAAGATLIMMRR
jgi:VanZ family protein